MKRPPTVLAVLLSALALTGCATVPDGFARAPENAAVTATGQELRDLPPPPAPIAVGVYRFDDMTGQFRPTDGVQTLSRAVTQGGTSILVQALRQAGGGKWFTVLERERADNLLRERQIIADTRARYLGETKINPEALPPLMFAGVLLEGGVIGYDSDTMTGGLGARYLGIGSSTKYRQDTITVYLRAVSVKTGEILSSVVVRKSIVSVGVDASTYRFIAFKDLLEIEGGVTVNEPGVVALEQAVGKATRDLIIDGARQGVWAFADPAAAAPLLAQPAVPEPRAAPRALPAIRRPQGK